MTEAGGGAITRSVKIAPGFALLDSRSSSSIEATSQSSANGARFVRRCVSRTSPVSPSSTDDTTVVLIDPKSRSGCFQGGSASWHLRISRTASRIGINLRMMRACFSKMPSADRPFLILMVTAVPSTICIRAPFAPMK